MVFKLCLKAYINKQRNFETVQSNLYRTLLFFMTSASLHKVDKTIVVLLSSRLLLNQPWSAICSKYSLPGRKTAEDMCRQGLVELIESS